MKKISSIFTALVIVFTLFNHSVSGQTKTTSKNSSSLSQKQKTTKFVIESGKENADGNPMSKIFVSAGKKKVFIMDVLGEASSSAFSNPSKEEYETMKDRRIPKNALAMCNSWYAGSGDYFYIAPSKKGVKVFHGWVEESTAEDREKGEIDEGYHWKLVKEIVL